MLSEALNIPYKDHITNEENRGKIQAAIGQYEDLVTLVKERKLRWFGRVSRIFWFSKDNPTGNHGPVNHWP